MKRNIFPAIVIVIVFFGFGYLAGLSFADCASYPLPCDSKTVSSSRVSSTPDETPASAKERKYLNLLKEYALTQKRDSEAWDKWNELRHVPDCGDCRDALRAYAEWNDASTKHHQTQDALDAARDEIIKDIK